MRHTFAVYVEDRPGVLNRVASFAGRGFNIESFTGGHTEVAGVSRLTMEVDTDADGWRRVEANLYKLVNVLRVEDITGTPAVLRELAMIKVATTRESRTHIMQLVEVFRARVVDVAPDAVVIETTGTEDKVDGLLEALRPYWVIEMVRTGRVAMTCGSKSVTAGPPGPARQKTTRTCRTRSDLPPFTPSRTCSWRKFTTMIRQT